MEKKKIVVRYANSNRVDFYEPIARIYFERVLNYSYDHCMITDLSSVCHFVGDDLSEGSSFSKVVELTLHEFDVNLLEIPDQLFVELFKQIADKKGLSIEF